MAGLVDRAREFAIAAHRRVGQLRKYTGQPYEEHLRRVVEMVSTVTDDAETIAAAWLHDTVEDTSTTLEEVEREFGKGVRDLVDAVSDTSRPQQGNRATRKALDLEHLARAPARAQTIKLADLIDNCQDICSRDPKFGRVFLGEMAGLLEVLTSGAQELQRTARSIHDKWWTGLSGTSGPPPR
jgi:(p)ppGpp synthase/HD superfamily hydrolase